MGRVWNNGGKVNGLHTHHNVSVALMTMSLCNGSNGVLFQVSAAFRWNKREFKDKVGSLQILVELPDHVRGFDYSWQPYLVCATFGEKEWHPVYVNYKGIISPCVVTFDEKQILGKVLPVLASSKILIHYHLEIKLKNSHFRRIPPSTSMSDSLKIRTPLRYSGVRIFIDNFPAQFSEEQTFSG